MVPLVLDPPRSKKSPNDTGILPGLSLPMLFLNFRPLLHPHHPIGRLQKAATQRGDLGGWKAAPALSLPGRLAGGPRFSRRGSAPGLEEFLVDQKQLRKSQNVCPRLPALARRAGGPARGLTLGPGVPISPGRPTGPGGPCGAERRLTRMPHGVSHLR